MPKLSILAFSEFMNFITTSTLLTMCKFFLFSVPLKQMQTNDYKVQFQTDFLSDNFGAGIAILLYLRANDNCVKCV